MGGRIAEVAVLLGLATLGSQCASNRPVPRDVAGSSPPAPAALPALPKPPPASPPVVSRLVVRVTDPSGTPVPGARVQQSTEDESVITAETDASGRAQLPRREGDGFVVRAETADGRAARWKRVQDTHGGGETTLVLLPGALLTVTVVAEGSRAPLGGATVTVLEGGTTTERADVYWGTPTAIGATVSSGVFGPVVVPRDRVLTVTARAPGHCERELSIASPGEGPMPPVLLELERGGVVTGTVRAPDGSAVPGAIVNIFSGEYASWADRAEVCYLSRDSGGVLAAGADANGVYRIDRIPLGGSFVVLAWAPGWAVSPPVAPVLVTVGRPTATADPVLRRPARLVVRVLSPEGRAVEGATVVRFKFDGRRTAATELSGLGPPGEFVLDGLRPGIVSLGAVAAGHGPVATGIDIEEGADRQLDVRLPAGVSIRGVVLGPDGRPAARAWVSVYRESSADDLHLITDTQPHPTDEGGRFEFRDLLRVPYLVEADGWDRGSVPEESCPTVTPPAEDLVLRLVPPPPMGVVRFRLVPPPGRDAPAELPYHLGSLNWRQGVFEIDREPGEGVLRYFPKGFAPLVIPYRVGGGETVDLGEIVLDEGAALRGRVVDPDGRPVAGAVARLDQTQSQGDPSATTGEDGAFRIEHGARGDNRIVVRREGFLEGEFTLSGGGDGGPVELVLRRGGLVRVRVETSAGLPAPGIGVRFALRGGSTAPEDALWETTDVRGRGERRLPAGTWEVQAGWDQGGAEVVVAEGAVVEVRLVVP